MILASIPSPSRGVIHLGPLPIRAYAAFIVLGIAIAVFVADRRLAAMDGGRAGRAAEIATWAVPFGLVGARLYHLATNPELYWGKDGQGTLAAFEIWHGGIGIWGAISGGALGAYIGCRRSGVSFPLFAAALAPGLALAQAVGRWGNYFNQELFGRPTSLPWGLQISYAHRPQGYEHFATFHPTFLYESIWDVGVALFVVWAERKWRLHNGRVFFLYVAAYTAGRFWIEALRIDDAHHYLGLRINDWMSILVFSGALVLFFRRRDKADDDTEPIPDEAERTVNV